MRHHGNHPPWTSRRISPAPRSVSGPPFSLTGWAKPPENRTEKTVALREPIRQTGAAVTTSVWDEGSWGLAGAREAPKSRRSSSGGQRTCDLRPEEEKGLGRERHAVGAQRLDRPPSRAGPAL